MKGLIRRLFIWLWHEELVEVARYVGASNTYPDCDGYVRTHEEFNGAIFVIKKMKLGKML